MRIAQVEQLRDRIRMLVVQEISATNLIAQQENPQQYIPRFIETLTQNLHELVIDELTYGRRKDRKSVV